jgi:hypothetical protein
MSPLSTGPSKLAPLGSCAAPRPASAAAPHTLIIDKFLMSGAHGAISVATCGPKRLAVKALPIRDVHTRAELAAFAKITAYHGHRNIIHVMPAVDSPYGKHKLLPMVCCCVLEPVLSFVILLPYLALLEV